LSTKIHASVQGMGQLIGFALTGGEIADITEAQGLLVGLEPAEVVADKGYDSDELVQSIRDAGAKAVIPPRRNRLQKRRWDRQIYRDRNIIERFFCRLKQFRRIATRYDKLAERYASIVTLGASFVWLATEL
jgi:transposase